MAFDAVVLTIAEFWMSPLPSVLTSDIGCALATAYNMIIDGFIWLVSGFFWLVVQLAECMFGFSASERLAPELASRTGMSIEQCVGTIRCVHLMFSMTMFVVLCALYERYFDRRRTTGADSKKTQ